MFVGLHVALAVRTNTPELVVEEAEAKALAKSAQNVMRHYDVAPNQVVLDWIAFAGCLGSIYGTRAFAIAARRAREREEAKGTGQVINFPFAPKPRPDQAAPPGPPPGPVQGAPPADYVPSVPQEFDGAEEFGGEVY